MMAKKRTATVRDDAQRWTFLSNHAFVVICIAQDPDIRLRDVATIVGITERAVQRIIADLESGGYISRTRQGRRNRYDLHLKAPLSHPLGKDCSLDDMLSLFSERSRSNNSRTRAKRSAKKKAAPKRTAKKKTQSRS